MSFQLTLQIDPHIVLGIAPGASLLEIREAYRRKAKQHHPDTGGEEWAFRVVSQSYEALSTARVVQASQAEYHARPPRSASAAADVRAETPPRDQPRGPGMGAASGGGGADSSASRTKAPTETVRPGVTDVVHDPTKVVDIEKLWVRFEVDQVWLLQDDHREERFLSCSLNITWPEPGFANQAGAIPDGAETLLKLKEVFDDVHINTPVINSRCKVEDHKFQGWLSYPNTQLAWSACNKLHEDLNARGLSVKQWTRDLIIPRDWR